MQQLTDLMEKLADDEYSALSVINNDTGEAVCSDKLGTAIKNEYGTIADFFNALHDKNIRRIIIQERRKNGSAFKSIGRPFFADMNAKTEDIIPGVTFVQPPGQQPVYQPLPQQGLNGADLGLNGIFGLMGGVQGDIIHAYKEFPKVEKERDELKRENKQLEKDVARLEAELLKKDFSDAKATGNKEMLTGLAETFAPIALALLNGKSGGAALPGAGGELNGGAGVSPAKQQALELIMELGDDEAAYMARTIEGFSTNPQFGNELIQLLKTHQIINP